MKLRMTPQEVAKALMECPEDAAVVCSYNVTNEVYSVVYCPQNNVVYLTDDENWIIDFLMEDLETDIVNAMTWYGKENKMQTVYIRFELDTDFVGTTNVIYRQYNFPEGWTAEQIENYIWEEYHDLQIEHYESYSDYYEYCQERGYTEDDTVGVDNYDYWDEYVIHVDEQGGYHVQNFAFDEDEMDDAIYPLEVITVEER